MPEGAVTAQTLVGDGPVRPGATFDLAVSDGPAPVPVPDVVGRPWSEAKELLTDAGFRIDYDLTADALPGIVTVRSVSPAAGTTAPRGSTVAVRFNSIFG